MRRRTFRRVDGELESERKGRGAELENTRGEEASWHSAVQRLSDRRTLLLGVNSQLVNCKTAGQ